MKDLLSQVRSALAQAPPGEEPPLRIYGHHGWPLPWYFRKVQGMEYRQDIPPDADANVVIVEEAMAAELLPVLKGEYRRREYFLRPRQRVLLMVRVESRAAPGDPASRL